jgi:hypothetical protein
MRIRECLPIKRLLLLLGNTSYLTLAYLIIAHHAMCRVSWFDMRFGRLRSCIMHALRFCEDTPDFI